MLNGAIFDANGELVRIFTVHNVYDIIDVMLDTTGQHMEFC